MLVSVTAVLAQVWVEGDEYVLFKSSDTYPFNVIIYGDSELSTEGNENSWYSSPTSYLYFTTAYTTSAITLTATIYSSSPTDWVVGYMLIPGACNLWNEYGNVYGTAGDWVERTYTGTCVMSPGQHYMEFSGAGGNNFGINIVTLVADTLQREPPEETLYTCPTIEDYHFIESETLTETWLLLGATITDSILTISPSGVAAQNLDSLSSHVTYNAVISVTNATLDPILDVILGIDAEHLTITGTGIFTTTFTTPGLAGPLAIILQGDEANLGDIDIDYICLYRSDSNTQAECIAPVNGDFTTADYWTWLRSARWWTPAKAAFLPHTEVGMTQAQSFTLPSLADGEYLLISFEAKSETNIGIIGGKVWGGVATDTNISYFYFETYPNTYHYEADISTLAGDTNGQLIMGNVSETPPDGYDGTGIDNIILDNVCIFVSDEPWQLPYAIDENQFINLGLNYTTCEDIDGLWAWYGINMAQYRATYAAGASVWDPIDWVPWLISAIFVNLASWSCLVMSIYAAALATAEYLLNNFLNFVFWLLASWENFKDWLYGWGLWLALSIANILLAIFPWLGDLIIWLYDSGLNLAGWAWSIVAGFWVWLATYFFNLNGLRALFNWLIDYGWNPLMTTLGVVLSALLNVFILIWNSGLFPILLALFSPLGLFLLLPSMTAMILELIYAAWDIVYMLFMWIWENIISVGHVPLTFYYSFDDAMNSTAYSALVSCTGVNFWCTFLAGVQIVNQVISHSILYPIVIVGIVLSTIWVIWENIKELFSINIQ